jgi:UDP-N-acetylmuramoyl-L-alanyl-D-glutamate--2,6-diaminopimelate ligase
MPRGFLIRGTKVFICKQGTRAALTDVAAEFYGHPENQLKLIGITGTKGKTTVAELAAFALNKSGIKTGYIGTNGVDFDRYHFDTPNTTPESCDLYEYLSMMVLSRVKLAVIEVSSQALMMGRVRGITFDTCVYINLYHDHIGGAEHRDFEHYKECKKLLFSQHCGRIALINADSPYSAEFASAAPIGVIKMLCSAEKESDIYAKNIENYRNCDGMGVSFDCITEQWKSRIALGFPGRFNVSNALLVIGICKIYGLTSSLITEALSVARVSGRFEVLRIGGVDYVIDYAHNGESLRSVLTVLREYEPSRLICLFGSVGGRTQLRRADLGSVAASLADFSIITSDNPDCEPPENIIADIAEQFEDKNSYIGIPDRREAIIYASSIARHGDIVLLAGKGHEKYQIIGKTKYDFDESAIALSIMEELGK